MEKGKETQDKKNISKENMQVRMTSKNSTNVKTQDNEHIMNIQRFSIKIPHISH
ncbi:hypothetical protein ACFL3Q_09335 [Planctomycetota bacterium]